MIGNDEQFCNNQCLNIPFLFTDTTFNIDFLILPISGSNLVLVFNG